MSELEDYDIMDIEAMDDERLEKSESGKIQVTRVYIKSDVDAILAEKDAEIAELKADYRDACDRLQTANIIKDEQKAKATKLLGCLKYLVMRDLIKDCPPKKVAAEIMKECDNGLG